MKDKLTIVIPCKNEKEYISRTLREIGGQYGIEGVRIIISDAQSTDGTIGEILRIKKEDGLDISVIKGGLPSFGRNQGAKLASTELILFLDADITFTSNRSVYSAIKKLERKNLDLVGTFPSYKGEFDIRASIMFFINSISTAILSVISPFAIGGFFLIRKDKFESLGGFDELAEQSEDWLLSRKIGIEKFGLLPFLITQDNRRFKRFGYLNMIRLIIRNLYHMNSETHFRKNSGYWGN
jgi:glycosyltransferase involved in cell wall biosynthesis